MNKKQLLKDLIHDGKGGRGSVEPLTSGGSLKTGTPDNKLVSRLKTPFYKRMKAAGELRKIADLTRLGGFQAKAPKAKKPFKYKPPATPAPSPSLPHVVPQIPIPLHRMHRILKSAIRAGGRRAHNSPHGSDSHSRDEKKG